MRDTRIGAVSFPHRFGSSLNAHFHYHVLVLDGVFSEGEAGAVRFHEASELEPEHWKGLQGTVQRRVLRDHASRDDRHGVLAPNGRLRARIVAMGRSETTEDAEPEVRTREEGAEEAWTAPSRSSSRIPWAQLLARIYEILPLLCPRHGAKRGRGGEMRIVPFLTEPATVQRILLHLDLPHRPPPVAPARGPLRATSSWIRLPPSIPQSPSRCPNTSSTSRCPTRSTTDRIG